MKRVVWLTDIHLNFLAPAESREFLAAVDAAGPDAVLIGGDIGEAPDLTRQLALIAESLSCPAYFVLGNHDYYFGSLRQVRSDVERICRESPRLVWMPNIDFAELSPTVGLCGHDGWADARLGDYERSLVMMNDYRLIEELAAVSKADRWPLLKSLGDAAAEHARRVLPPALDRYPHVVFLTHVPPLREACWYQGQISNDEWLPHFTCLALGQALVEIMRKRPDRKLTVLCGHTHSSGETWPLPNVQILTGAAEYGRPKIQQTFEFE